ncbi:MAG: hypothetical protein WAK52_04905 [Trichococcus sp.]
MPYSLWRDTTEHSIQQIIDNCLDYENWYTNEIDPYDESKLRFEINKRFLDNHNLKIGDTNFFFNVLDYEMEKVRPREAENAMRATRVQLISGFVIVFTDGNTTKYITNKTYGPNTLTNLRKINNYIGQLEIIDEKFSIDSDLFFWVVNKVIDFPGVQLGDAQNVKIELMTGFKGETDDKLAEISGSGDRILNLISTLTFLVENEKLSRIEMQLCHQKDTYGLKLGINSYLEINAEKYRGGYMKLPDEEMIPHIVLNAFLVVIPDLLAIYDQEIKKGQWDNKIKREFLGSIGETIQERIQEKLGILE